MNDESIPKWRWVLGWAAAVVSTAFTSFWAFWGIIENFHEGWYQPSWLDRIAMMFVQYLSFMLAFLAASLISIRWRYVGAGLHVAAGIFAFWFFSGGTAHRLFVPPMLLLGVAYWFGRIEPRTWAHRIAVAVPLVTLVVCGIEPAYRAATRVDDGIRSARHLNANGADLIWAPEGPGWPDHGMSWQDAAAQCERLTEDGTKLADSPQNIWRLPTVDEAVRSQCRHGENSGGSWDAATARATYLRWPDKETPLWNPTSKVIYWWTGTKLNEDEVYTISYRGGVHRRRKDGSYGYRAFRAVKRGDLAQIPRHRDRGFFSPDASAGSVGSVELANDRPSGAVHSRHRR